jgi:glycine cleavage system H lipoate-binding protein
MIFADPSKASWGSLFGTGQNVPVKCYMINNDESKGDIAKFLNADKGVINGIEVESSTAIVSAVQNDPLAIGFCKLSDILATVNQQIVDDVKLMPIDRNANDKIDYSENIYQDLNSFTRGVWIGKYPKALYSSIYSVSAAKPVNEKEVAFLKWVLTDGQQYVALNGYSDLAIHERQSKVDDLNLSGIELVAANTEKSNMKLILLILGLTIVFSFALEAVLRYRKTINVSPESSVSFSQTVFNENSLSLPAGLYFDKSHTWAFMEKDGMVKIGIDDFLQHVTGSITQIKMKNPGDKVSKGEQVMTIIQKGKQLNIYSPVSGIIKEHNESLKDESSLLNSSPYAEGWIYSIEPTNWLREIQFLLMSEKYKIWIKDEFTRLRDFLASFVKPGTLEYSHVILQDGGELKDNLLSELGPEAWDDFQTNFLDNSK